MGRISTIHFYYEVPIITLSTTLLNVTLFKRTYSNALIQNTMG